MPAPEIDESRPAGGRLVESHEALDRRIIAFHFLIAAAMLILAGGLAYRQLIQTGRYDESERVQTQRRILLPGPRGNIYDRHHRLLVGNRARFSIVLYLDDLQGEFRTETLRIKENYRKSGESDVTWGQLEQIARASVVQRYLDQVQALLGRPLPLDVKELRNHFASQLLVPFPLVEDLTPPEFARLVEGLPVRSPLQLSVATVRSYPYGSAASHVLGYIGSVDNVAAADFPGADLTTLRERGTIGEAGLEKRFDALLQGKPGGAIYRVDPAGYKVNPPLEQRMPQPGRDLVTSLDLDLQLAAEAALNEFVTTDPKARMGATTGAVVALDVRTGEVLVLASKPDYDLSRFPHDAAAVAEATATKAWNDNAVGLSYMPGSTFKILVSIAGLHSGRLDPDDDSADCQVDSTSEVEFGNHWFKCDNGLGHHGHLKLPEAIADSCDVYFYTHGVKMGADVIINEARRMHLEGKTGIELPYERRSFLPNLKDRYKAHDWRIGDTAEISIGQGPIVETPLNLACFAASIARGETLTKPTLLHDPNRPAQHTEPIGLTPDQLALIRRGMEEVIKGGPPKATARPLSLPSVAIPGVEIAAKTGTATLGDRTDSAWFICYAPADDPQIAVCVELKGKIPGEGFGGGENAGPVAMEVLRKYFSSRSPASVQTAGSPSPGSPSPPP